jgi:hypothetical protein
VPSRTASKPSTSADVAAFSLFLVLVVDVAFEVSTKSRAVSARKFDPLMIRGAAPMRSASGHPQMSDRPNDHLRLISPIPNTPPQWSSENGGNPCFPTYRSNASGPFQNWMEWNVEEGVERIGE